ncbi:MAG: LysE family translocator [Chloroflexota bacterium]
MLVNSHHRPGYLSSHAGIASQSPLPLWYNLENSGLNIMGYYKELGKPGMLSLFVTSFIVGLSGALMPGPLLALTISSVAKYGFWAGPALVLGHAVAELSVVAALAKGLGKLLGKPLAVGVIGLVGGAFLLWMGYSLVTSFDQPLTLEAQGHATTGFGLSTVAAGIIVSVTNPYWVLWWATVGTTYVAWALQRRRAIGLTTFYIGHTLSDVVWYVAVSLAIAGGARLLKPEVYKGLLLVCGIALLGLGAYFVFSGARSLVRRHAA